jgi:hypothetical protein
MKMYLHTKDEVHLHTKDDSVSFMFLFRWIKVEFFSTQLQEDEDDYAFKVLSEAPGVWVCIFVWVFVYVCGG